MFGWKTMYNYVIGNLNSEQLMLGLEWKSKIVTFISDEAEKLGGIQHFCLTEKIGYFTFYDGQYINLVKRWCSTEKLCVIVSLAV